MISLVLADDQPLLRMAVAQLLSREPQFAVLGEASDGTEAVALTRTLRPDIVLMDIRMPRLNGIEATRIICADPQLAQTRIIILTTFEEDEYVLQALKAGASGFLGKGIETPALMEAIRTVHSGETLMSPRATRTLIDRYLSPGVTLQAGTVPPELSTLTEREREILVLVGQGKSNTDIASDLFISPQTAKTHVNRMMTKLYVHDRAQLVIIAYETGLLTPGQRE